MLALRLLPKRSASSIRPLSIETLPFVRPSFYQPNNPSSYHPRTMATAMGKRLEGKTIVVTGASSGIGKSTAMEFARTSPKNLKLILTARRIDSLKQLAEDIQNEVGSGVKVLALKLDISQQAEVENFVSSLPTDFQDIDILVNNAQVPLSSLHRPTPS